MSVPTVSRVPNGRSDVAPQTRKRVEALLHQHGYRRRSERARTSARLDVPMVAVDPVGGSTLDAPTIGATN